MTVLLFRKQALAAATSETQVMALPPAPVSWRILTSFLALMAVIIVAFVTAAGYARKETAVGALAPVTGAVQIVPVRAGLVASLLVKEGDRVEAGQVLLTLDSRQTLEDGGTLEASLTNALARQSKLLRDQIAAEDRKASAEDARLASLIKGTESELVALRAERSLQVERITLASERLETLRGLRKGGYVAKTDLRSQEEVWLSQRQSLVALDRQIAASEGDLAQARDQRDQIAPQTASKLAQLTSSLADLEQRQAEVTARGEQVVRSPVAGRVSALQTTIGRTVDPSRPVMTLMPEGSELRAELYVASRAIGFVAEGQRVRLMYDAFPFQRFGAYAGTVEQVSATVFTPNDATGTVSIKEPSYRIVVRLARQDVDAFGQAVPLQPDMTVKADIVLEERSILEWLLEPLYSARGRM
jgi:membrane fusion protein